MKLRIFSVTIALAVLAAPAMARHKNVQPPRQAISTYCATIQPGNPFSPYYDYGAWSKYRQRGSWDSSGDDRCALNPLYSPTGTPTYVPTPYAGSRGW